MTIRARLLLLVLSVLAPAVATALWLIGQTYHAERQAHERNLRDVTRALSMLVGRELDQRVVIARVLALSRNLDGAPDIEPLLLRQFEQQARRAMQGLDGWVELSAQGGVLLSRVAGAPVGMMQAVAADELTEAPRVLPLQATGADGSLRAAVVQPVQRDGRTRLNLAVTILPSELQRVVDQQHVPGDWVAAVLDNQGTVVARHPGGTAYAGRKATVDLKQRLAADTEGLFESLTLDGVVVTGYFSTSPQGWTYLTAMPKSQFAGHMPTAVLQVAVVAVLLLVLTVGAALWVARHIARPVQSLKRAAGDLQAGRPVQPLNSGIVECNEVALALARASEALRHSQTELERRVDEAVERTRLAEQRVSQSQRIEALGRLTGGVAHDFNNLLGVISNSAHLIERQATGLPGLQLPVAATLRAVEVGSRLTQHLLRVAGRQSVRPQTVDLTRYLPEVQELLQTVLGKGVEVAVAVAPSTWRVKADAGELELALINLALNARDAMAAGGQVWLQARNADDAHRQGLTPGDYVLITVTDNGTGIDESLAARVFEPFFTTKAVGKGTGLGLSQVHGFCVQAGGAARLASTPGLGTTVSLLLPAGLAVDVPPAPAVTNPPQASAAGLRVLLVEDSEALGDATAALLEAFHCGVQRAAGAEEALRLLAGGAGVDVVLSDVVMPGEMDGLALGRSIRQRWPGLPVVLITGYSTARAAIVEFVVLDKPATPQALMAALRGAVAGLPAAGR